MEKNLKAIKNSITIVTGDKEVNELCTEYMQKDIDCFGRAYVDGHPECRQCVVIAEFKDFETGEFRRDPLWVICFETCKFLSEKEQIEQFNDPIKEVGLEMQQEVEQKIDEKFEVVGIPEEKDEEDVVEKPPIQKPRRKSINPDGHRKTCYNLCSKCGEKKSTYESTYNNRLKRYGNIEEMNKRYLCKKCRKA